MGRTRYIGLCYNGHINDTENTALTAPPKFCNECGNPVILDCPHCNTELEFFYWDEDIVDIVFRPIPNHCHEYGQAFPWMEAKIKATQELADELKNLTKQEKEELKNAIPDLVSETPRTKVAAIRFKRLATKADSETLEMFKEILTEVLAETAKKMLMP